LQNIQKSQEFLQRAEKVIPCQTQTFSKGPKYFPENYPKYLKEGFGATVIDIDGNKYLDFICGLGAITLGYKYINEAIRIQLDKGIIFSLPSPLEVDLAELLCEVIPCAEMVRFSKTGSEATSAAIKAARAYTGRDVILHWGYHGWHDWYSTRSDKPKGIPSSYKDYIAPFEYNNINSLRKLFAVYSNQVAAVIMEPVTFTPPENDFLTKVYDITHAHGAVLIFDEMVTGFRWSLGGAQQYFGIHPDLACFGKGMANGMPISAVVGKKEIMSMFEEENQVFFSTTFGGECLSLAAAIITIKLMQKGKYFSHIWSLGKRIIEEVNKIQGLSAYGYPCRPMLQMKDETPELRSLLMAELCKKSILTHSGALNLCLCHTDSDIDRLLSALDMSMRDIREGKVKLEGRPAKMSFRRT